MYELALVPLVYGKTLFVVIWATQGLFATIWNTLKWILIGLLYCIFFVLRDVGYYLYILSMTEGCKEYMGLSEGIGDQEFDEDEEVRCFNEARDIVIVAYLEAKKKCLDSQNNDKDKDEEEEGKIDIENLNVRDMLIADEDLIADNPEAFLTKASTLLMQWKQDQSAKIKAQEQAA